MQLLRNDSSISRGSIYRAAAHYSRRVEVHSLSAISLRLTPETLGFQRVPALALPSNARGGGFDAAASSAI
jgi:hypothetical protein